MVELVVFAFGLSGLLPKFIGTPDDIYLRRLCHGTLFFKRSAASAEREVELEAAQVRAMTYRIKIQDLHRSRLIKFSFSEPGPSGQLCGPCSRCSWGLE
jgi:hypothetical protein